MVIKISGTVIISMVTMLMIIPVRAQLQPPSFGLIPPFLDKEVQQCWSSFQNVNGCLLEVYSFFINGKVGAIGPACCKAITEINANCWLKIFPFNPYFPPLLKAYCNGKQPPITLNSADDVSSTKELTIASHTELADASLNTFEQVDPIVTKCLNSLTTTTTQGCKQEVITSFFSCQVHLLGPSCCKALTAIDNNCWPKLFPFNPFFPPLIKNYCTNQLLTANPAPSPISV